MKRIVLGQVALAASEPKKKKGGLFKKGGLLSPIGQAFSKRAKGGIAEAAKNIETVKVKDLQGMSDEDLDALEADMDDMEQRQSEAAGVGNMGEDEDWYEDDFRGGFTNQDSGITRAREGRPGAFFDSPGALVGGVQTWRGSMPDSGLNVMRKGLAGAHRDSPGTLVGALSEDSEESRTVKGAGGWIYQQFEDGTIKIIGAPAGYKAGSTLSEGNAWEAITNEIGDFPDEDETETLEATKVGPGEWVTKQVRRAGVALSKVGTKADARRQNRRVSGFLDDEGSEQSDYAPGAYRDDAGMRVKPGARFGGNRSRG